MGQIELFQQPRHPGPIVAAYGGGVNTIAALVLLKRMRPLLVERGQWLQAVVMADPGDEHDETYRYRDEVATPWLIDNAMPPVITVSRKSEAVYRPRACKTEQMTLREECLRIKALPSIAYGWKKCSQKYKAAPQAWWIERQQWARDHWANGGKITRVIGYDTDEPERALDSFKNPDEARRYGLFYVLLEAGYDREGCIELIKDEGLPVPPKSSCKYCPSKQLWEWRELRKNDPKGFAEALEMEANAEIDNPDVVGLVRVMPHGKRQLKLLDQMIDAEERVDPMPCECSL